MIDSWDRPGGAWSQATPVNIRFVKTNTGLFNHVHASRDSSAASFTQTPVSLHITFFFYIFFLN